MMPHAPPRSVLWRFAIWFALGLGGVLIAALPAQTVPAEPPVREAYAAVPGARIFYRDTGGSGVPVILLHAATGSSQVWEYQIPAFRAAGYRVIAYDRRGWGRTVINLAEPQPGIAADDLLGLLDHLGLNRVHLVGTAGGAPVVLDFALSHPQRVRGLVLANNLGLAQDAEVEEVVRRIRPPQLAAMPPEFRELGPHTGRVTRLALQRWVELRKDEPAAGIAGRREQPLRHRLTFALLQTIQAPTLLVAGGADLFALSTADAGSFAERIKGLRDIRRSRRGPLHLLEEQRRRPLTVRFSLSSADTNRLARSTIIRPM